MQDFKAIVRQLIADGAFEPIEMPELARQLKVTKKTFAPFVADLEELHEAGEIHVTRNGRISKPRPVELIAGTIRRTQSGGAFVVPKVYISDYEYGIYIRPEDLGDSQTGDEVLVRLIDRSKRPGRPLHAKVAQTTAHATRVFVGTYFEADGKGFVRIDGTQFRDPISVGDPGAKGARPDDKVVIELLRFPTETHLGQAVLTEVLGGRGTPGVDTLTIIHELGLPDEFPEEVLEQARSIAAAFNENDFTGRVDLTGETIITIDPVDARDFDDAISLTKNDAGNWDLGVHIADVSAFVPEGTPIDAEAYRRGTSVYLPDRVLPMLPELISNGLASLQEAQPRYTQTAWIEFDPQGTVISSRFARTVIKTARRFAYEEVLPILNDPHSHPRGVTKPVRQLLEWMYELAMLLRKRRFANGSLELDMPETKIDFDKEGKVCGAHVVAHDESHQIIEEFMLAANQAVATALRDRGLPFLRRVHNSPEPRKLKLFAQFAASLGHPIQHYESRKELQALLDRTKGTPHQQAIHFGFLRSMRQAEYSPEELGHYALAFEHYCHFTSPIRRYPDLMIHRLFAKLCDRKAKINVPSFETLRRDGEQTSRTERRAAEAERELIKIKLLTYLSTRIGEQFEAVITGVQEYGFFCQGLVIPAEGLVHVTSLPDDYYTYEQSQHALSGRRQGNSFKLGDKVAVLVAHVDVDRRQLDLVLDRPGEKERIEKEAALGRRPAGRPPARTRDRSGGGSSRGGPRGQGGSSRGGSGRGGSGRGGNGQGRSSDRRGKRR
jgi:ribonuclease R